MAPHGTRREFAAASLQAEPYLEREHSARWAALAVAHATSGITANVLTLLLPRSIFAHSSTDRIPRSEFSLQTLIGIAFPQRNEMRTHLCLGSTEIAQWIVRCCRSIFAVYVHANSSILMFALTVTCRTNPVRVPGVIVRLCSLGWPTGLHGQVNPCLAR